MMSPPAMPHCRHTEKHRKKKMKKDYYAAIKIDSLVKSRFWTAK